MLRLAEMDSGKMDMRFEENLISKEFIIDLRGRKFKHAGMNLGKSFFTMNDKNLSLYDPLGSNDMKQSCWTLCKRH